ncbi:hypothetical protein F4777DRAFT_572149 [Nemania sp. FL0916]|nr:hypothetical protein F4777DRAFT_572149 [Nemania sp. FL0916]
MPWAACWLIIPVPCASIGTTKARPVGTNSLLGGKFNPTVPNYRRTDMLVHAAAKNAVVPEKNCVQQKRCGITQGLWYRVAVVLGI